jgi:hypothetical protein
MDASYPKNCDMKQITEVACNAAAFDICLMLSILVKMLKQNLENQVLFLNHIIQCWNGK